MTKKSLLTLGCALFSLNAFAVDLLYWDTFPIEGGIEGPTTLASTFAAEGISASTLALGPGITPRATNDPSRFQGENFNSTTLQGALADGDYFEFDLTPSDGMVLNLSTLTVTLRNRGSSTEERTIAIVSSQDGFTTPVATFLLPAGNSIDTSPPVTVDVSQLGPVTSPTTVRIVAYFASGFDDSRTHPLTIGYASEDELTTARALLVSGEMTTGGSGNTWLGYDVDENGWVDTGSWLGLVYVDLTPWIWSHSLGKYLHIIDDSGWVYVP